MKYQIKFYFNTTESSVFGSVGGNKTVEVDESVKDLIVDGFQAGTAIMPIQMSETEVHYLNTKNVNYVSVKQVDNVEESGGEGGNE